MSDLPKEFEKWFADAWRAFPDKDFVSMISSKVWALKAWRELEARAGEAKPHSYLTPDGEYFEAARLQGAWPEQSDDNATWHGVCGGGPRCLP